MDGGRHPPDQTDDDILASSALLQSTIPNPVPETEGVQAPLPVEVPPPAASAERSATPKESASSDMALSDPTDAMEIDSVDAPAVP